MRPSRPNEAIGRPRARIERVEKRPLRREDSRLVAARPVGDAAIGPAPSMPESNCQRTAPLAASSATTRCLGVVVNSTPSTTIGLVCRPPVSPRIVGPRHLELPDVGAVDLGQARVAHLLGPAAVRRPAAVGGAGAGRASRSRPGTQRPPAPQRTPTRCVRGGLCVPGRASWSRLEQQLHRELHLPRDRVADAGDRPEAGRARAARSGWRSSACW